MEEENILVVERNDIGDEKFYKIYEFIGYTTGYVQPYTLKSDIRWFDEFNFCGCGIRDSVKEYIYNILNAMDQRSNSGGEINNIDHTIIMTDQENIKYFVLYVLHAMGLTEHGSSVNGSWLTKEGKEYLNTLKKEQQ